ncbi:MAG: pteridine reductase [Gammaproteobacteria bacterium]|nr:pteridine reductase [Gammaproteobacteria bacterium]
MALISGAARRIGAAIAQTLHHAGMNVVIHYRSSVKDAEQLKQTLEAQRPNSVLLLQADLLQTETLPKLVKEATQKWGRLDLLVNNASSFYPTEVGQITEAHWDDLMGSNLKAPLFLSQAATPALQKQGGNIINIVDIHGLRPLKGHPLYCAAKAGLTMLTQSLAKELGPEIRVNGIAPGSILWPEGEAEVSNAVQQQITEQSALKRQGGAEDIANTVLFLVRDGGYISGQIIAVDGGRMLSER